MNILNRFGGDARKYIFSMIDETTNSYDYDNDFETTDELWKALGWIEDGDCIEVAVLDACSLEYLGYLDEDDLHDARIYQED